VVTAVGQITGRGSSATR